MEIKPDEIASILRERIEGLETDSADLSEVGTVLSVADGMPVSTGSTTAWHWRCSTCRTGSPASR